VKGVPDIFLYQLLVPLAPLFSLIILFYFIFAGDWFGEGGAFTCQIVDILVETASP
jgi:hypothetical protein